MMLKFYKGLFFWLLFSYVDDPAGGDPNDPPADPPADPPSDPPADPSDPPSDPVAAKWPEDWREQMSGGDEKALKQLGRYATPNDVYNKARALEQRMSSGELKAVAPFPAEGTDKEKSAWREENNVPLEAKYELKMPEGFVIGEADQPAIDSFMEFAHANNMATPDVNAAINWYFQNQETAAEARNDLDTEFQTKNTDELRAEWGDDYRGNVNRINGLLDTAPQDVKEAIMGARLPDGNPLGSDAGVLKYFAQLAHEVNPVTTLVPGSGANAMNAIADEISKIEGLMANRQSEYYKGPTADKMQSRYRDLIEARDKSKAA